MIGRNTLNAFPFDVSCRDESPPRIVLVGEIDMLTAPALDRAYDWIAARPASDVVVDVKSVAFLGSVGIGFLVRLAAYLDVSGHTVELRSANDYVRRVLEICGLAALFDLGDDAGAA